MAGHENSTLRPHEKKAFTTNEEDIVTITRKIGAEPWPSRWVKYYSKIKRLIVFFLRGKTHDK